MALLDEPIENLNESDVSFMPVAVRYGLILGGITVILTVLMGLLKIKMSSVGTGIGIAALSLGLMIGTVIYAVRAHRDGELGGYASFLRVFLLSLVVLLIGAVIGQLFNYLYFNYINPGYVQEVLDSTKEMLEKLNVPEDKIDESMVDASAKMQSMGGVLKSLAMSSIGYGIVALIFGAAMKRVRSTFA